MRNKTYHHGELDALLDGIAATPRLARTQTVATFGEGRQRAPATVLNSLRFCRLECSLSSPYLARVECSRFY